MWLVILRSGPFGRVSKDEAAGRHDARPQGAPGDANGSRERALDDRLRIVRRRAPFANGLAEARPARAVALLTMRRKHIAHDKHIAH